MHLHPDTQPAAERIRCMSTVYHERLSVFLSPLPELLDARVDRRLAHTFSLLVEAIIRFRHRQPVFHPRWLKKKLSRILLRPGKGHTPLYLLTNLPVQHVNKAWRVVFCYGRRWQVEAAFRYSRSELALESPRLWFWENRLKLMLILSVVYDFLLSLLQTQELQQLLRQGCHRTGKRYQEALMPLYRVRTALMHIWTQAQSLNLG